MRVAPDQLFAAVIGYLAEVAYAALFEQQGKEVDLEQNIAELIDERCVIARVGRVGQLVGLLDGVRDDCSCGLLTIPRTLKPQLAGQLIETAERSFDLVAAHGDNANATEPAGALKISRRMAVR